MNDYATVLDALRTCANGECDGCPRADKCEKYLKKALLPYAADAIEELLAEKAKIENSGKLLAAAFERLKEKVPPTEPKED